MSVDAAERLRQCLNRHVKVELDDGRTVFGRFRCSDAQNNVVLTECVEQRRVRDVDGERAALFRTNLVLIPAPHIVSFCVDHVHDGSVDVSAPPRLPSVASIAPAPAPAAAAM